MEFRSDAQSAFLTAVRLGEPEALDALLDGYRGYLKLLARTQIDRRWHARIDPSDVVQETLLGACQAFSGFRGQTSEELIAWLRRILIRNIADAVRHHQAPRRDLRRDQSLDEALERSSEAILAALNTSSSSPSGAVSRQEQSILVANALERLPDEYRDVILLRQFEQLPFSEVARELNRSSGAVRMLFARAINRLRQELERIER